MCSLQPSELSRHPVDIGTRTEAVVICELIKRGHCVLVPVGVNHRFDMVIQLDGRFQTVQCKTARLRDGAIRVNPIGVHSNRAGNSIRDYLGEVDMFAVYCPETDRVYMIPAADMPRRSMHLRVDSPRNGQRKRVRWARDYELPA